MLLFASTVLLSAINNLRNEKKHKKNEGLWIVSAVNHVKRGDLNTIFYSNYGKLFLTVCLRPWGKCCMCSYQKRNCLLQKGGCFFTLRLYCNCHSPFILNLRCYKNSYEQRTVQCTIDWSGSVVITQESCHHQRYSALIVGFHKKVSAAHFR